MAPASRSFFSCFHAHNDDLLFDAAICILHGLKKLNTVAMPRRFNTAGPNQPDIHYTLDPEPRLPGLRALIDQREYFVLHAPRQSGKTTRFIASIPKKPDKHGLMKHSDGYMN